MLTTSGLRTDRSKQRTKPPFAMLPTIARTHLGKQLRAAYREFVAAEPPPNLLDLIARLDGPRAVPTKTSGSDFRDGLTGALPALRAFAQSLAGSQSRADDLVQETLLKAWANQERFVPGTNLKAWLFTILRNQFYSECRKHRREVEDADGVFAAQLTAPAAQEHGSDLRAVLKLVGKLPATQREALLLVGTQGMTYEAAAKVTGCEIGTMKSRVSRARAILVQKLETPPRRVPV